MALVYVTVPREDGESIAHRLVDERLAAGVNRIACDSTYRWEGEVLEAGEEILLVQTTADRYLALCERLQDLHPHEVPCIERFDEADALDAFADWRAAATEQE